MPELPDVTIYVERLTALLAGRTLNAIRLNSPFLVRTAEPPVKAAEGRAITAFRRIGKRVVWELEGGLFLVIHLMIAGRFHWKKPGAGIGGKINLAAFDFDHGTMLLTEASPKKRASLHVVSGELALADFDPGGLEVLAADFPAFKAALTRENRTIKRALTDPRILSGIGNAYSDEVLFLARLSPVTLTSRLGDEALRALYHAIRDTLTEWTDRLRSEIGEGFPEKVTAFRPDFAVHGRYGQPCTACGSPVQRIVYAENESNYCATCQTAGKLLADRSLSKLFHGDWPRTLEELELRKRR
jgi:formamidopyrimidine-DNA glycosylase